MNASEFQVLTERCFGFLQAKFGFCVIPSIASDTSPEPLRNLEVRYENATTGVHVCFEAYEQLPSVHLQKLTTRESFPFGLLIMLRAPDLNPLASERSLPLKQPAETLLARYAELLEMFGRDVLQGDFGVFPSLRDLRAVMQKKRGGGDPSFVYF